MAGDGGGIDDLALVAACLELSRRCLSAPDDAVDIDAEDAIQIVRADIVERLHLCDAGIVDDDVEAAQFLFGVLDGGKDLVAVADIRREGRSLDAMGLDLGLYGLELVGLDVDQRQIGAVPGQPQRYAATDAWLAPVIRMTLSLTDMMFASYLDTQRPGAGDVTSNNEGPEY